MTDTTTPAGGIDTSKDTLDAAIYGASGNTCVPNTDVGWRRLEGLFRSAGVTRVGIEATGGYERGVVRHLRKAGFTVQVLQPLQVRAFAKLHLRRAKTDRIDAALIAACTQMLPQDERVPRDARLEPLTDHLTYIEQIEEDIARLRTRLEHTTDTRLHAMMKADISSLSKRRLDEIKLLHAALCAHDDLGKRYKLVLSVRGIGPRTALAIVIRMPELGQISREEVAALAGLAPFTRQSGKQQGQAAYWRWARAVATFGVCRGTGCMSALESGVAGAVSASGGARQKSSQRGRGMCAKVADLREHRGRPRYALDLPRLRSPSRSLIPERSSVRLKAPFLRPGRPGQRRRAQRCSSMAEGHRHLAARSVLEQREHGGKLTAKRGAKKLLYDGCYGLASQAAEPAAPGGISEMTITHLAFDALRATSYSSSSQRIRVLSEDWISKSMYCPNCGQEDMTQSKNNSPSLDFYCDQCAEEYEPKSQKHVFGKKILDGAYTTMMKRLKESNNPNLLLLNYDDSSMSVTNLMIVPKHFFTSDIIEARSPLAPSARRAGWVGCNIVLESIPHSGRIFLVRNHIVQSKADVMELWQSTLFLRDGLAETARGWLVNVMKCVEDIGVQRFSLSDVYAFEARLRQLYPHNNHIKEKIRQQLQVLRNKGYLRFASKGFYEIVSRPSAKKS